MDVTEAFDALTRQLWRVRETVFRLLYDVTVTRLLLAADDRRLVPGAVRAVDRDLAALRERELERDIAVRGLAAQWGVDADDLTLVNLASWAPEPYRTVFEDHQRVFAELTTEIEQVSRQNRALARGQRADVEVAIEELVGPAAVPARTYDSDGHLDRLAGLVGGRRQEVL